MWLGFVLSFVAGYALKTYFANEFLGNIERTRLPGLIWRERGIWHWEATSDTPGQPRHSLSR